MKVKVKTKSVGQQINALYRLDQRIKRINARLTKVKQLRAKRETRLLKSFNNKQINGCKTSRATSSIKRTDYPTVKDRKKFFAFVAKTKAFDLLQARVATRAFNDRVEEGIKVPGVDVFTKISVSIRKRAGGK